MLCQRWRASQRKETAPRWPPLAALMLAHLQPRLLWRLFCIPALSLGAPSLCLEQRRGQPSSNWLSIALRDAGLCPFMLRAAAGESRARKAGVRILLLRLRYFIVSFGAQDSCGTSFRTSLASQPWGCHATASPDRPLAAASQVHQEAYRKVSSGAQSSEPSSSGSERARYVDTCPKLLFTRRRHGILSVASGAVLWAPAKSRLGRIARRSCP